METKFHQLLDKIDRTAEGLGSKLHIGGKNVFKGIYFVVLLIILGTAAFISTFGRSLIGVKND